VLLGEGEDVLGGARVDEARLTRPERQVRIRREVLARLVLVPAGARVAEIESRPVRNRDGQHEPVDERNAITASRVVVRRADLLGASRTLEEAALDRYVFLREAFLQRRRSLIYDGRPPRERPPAE